jgi:hypothetical protein
VADWTSVLHTDVLVYPFRAQNTIYLSRTFQSDEKIDEANIRRYSAELFRYDDYLMEQAKANFSR